MHRGRVENIQNILGIELQGDIAAGFHQPLCSILDNCCYKGHQRGTPAHLDQLHHAGRAGKLLQQVLDVSLLLRLFSRLCTGHLVAGGHLHKAFNPLASQVPFTVCAKTVAPILLLAIAPYRYCTPLDFCKGICTDWCT